MKMTSTMLKAAYVMFLTSFFVWLSVLVSVAFPSGIWSTPITFPNSSLFMLFFGSAIVAAASCLVIGLDYMKLDFRLKHRPRHFPQNSKLHATIPLSQLAIVPGGKEKEELPVSADEDEAISILVLPQFEEEQEADSCNQRAKSQ